MTGIILAVLIAVIVYPQARNAWGNVPAVVITAVGMGLALTIGLFALPFFALGLYARHVPCKRPWPAATSRARSATVATEDLV